MTNYRFQSQSIPEKSDIDHDLEVALQQTLYRISCPSTQDLGEYQLGMLASAEANSISQHLQNCPHCSQEVAQLDDFLAATEPQEHPQPVSKSNKIKTWMAELVQGLSVEPSLAPAAVRGAKKRQVDDIEPNVTIRETSDLDSYEYSYRVSETDWQFEIRRSQTIPDVWEINQIDIPDSNRADQKWQLEVWWTDLPESECVRRTEIDPIDMTIDGLVAGKYTLIFSDGLADEIQIPDLQIG